MATASKRVKSTFRMLDAEKAAQAADELVHVIRDGVICDTESRGFPTPQNRSPLEIVVDATAGFVPLWEPGMTLRWRFQERSMLVFADPEEAKAGIKELLGEALLAWGPDVAPVRFAQDDDLWDFEIVMRRTDNCRPGGGCVLASAFFPDSGRHELTIYPRMFTQSREEQVETLIHEIGHMFGLRHFFAAVREAAWPSEVFGVHQKFSIMNYGQDSKLTPEDRSDLALLYQQAWSGQLRAVNGTPIRLFRPFSAALTPPESPVAVGTPARVLS